MMNSERAPTPSNAYSFSRIKCFHQCPLRYRYRYLDGFKEAFRSIESFLGNAVHEVLEWLYVERDRSSSPDEATMLDRFAAAWTAGRDDSVVIVRVDDGEESYLRTGREMLSRFLRDTFSRDSSETISLEQRLSVPLSERVVFTGFADRVGRTDQGRLFVVDYKTSRHEGDGSEFSEGLQAPLYAACVLGHQGEDEGLAGYHYLRHGTTRWQHVDGNRAEMILNRFLELVEEVEAVDDFPASPSVLCAWCGFNARCPAAEVPGQLSGGLRAAEDRGTRLL
jgi:putative RecB family exonuclease